MEQCFNNAFGITVPKALGDFLVFEALYKTDGCAISVTDQDILYNQAKLAEQEGLFVCPEGAATLAAARQLLKSGWIKSDEKVVLLNTGSGLKYPDTVTVHVPVLQPEDELKG